MLRRLAASFLVIGLVVAATPSTGRANELACDVSVDYSNLSGSDYTFLDELELRVEEYLNEEAWTEDRFQDFERINCSFQIFFQEALSLTDFRVQVVVASRRPIYATTQQTPVVRFSDENWRFSYAKGQPLVHDLQSYDALASVLDFYAYILLGYDYDTFSRLGGTPYFEQARRVADLAQSTGATGWSPVGGQGRNTLIQELLDPRFRPLREAYFDYHFGALDRFVEQTEGARQQVLTVLQSLRALEEETSRQYVMDVFYSAKYQELAAIFEGSSLNSQAYALLSELDPSHLSAYKKLAQ